MNARYKFIIHHYISKDAGNVTASMAQGFRMSCGRIFSKIAHRGRDIRMKTKRRLLS
jgi:hypothetical protein